MCMSARVKMWMCFNPATNEAWWTILQETLTKYNVKQHNTYGVDEAGCQLSGGKQEHVLGACKEGPQYQQWYFDSTFSRKTNKSIQSGIFKKKGWTNGEISVVWIEQFNKETSKKANGKLALQEAEELCKSYQNHVITLQAQAILNEAYCNKLHYQLACWEAKRPQTLMHLGNLSMMLFCNYCQVSSSMKGWLSLQDGRNRKRRTKLQGNMHTQQERLVNDKPKYGTTTGVSLARLDPKMTNNKNWFIVQQRHKLLVQKLL
ncbi:hypothetical protein F4604DRAFT_1691313 [Suillus subluteus]|nr:hypothetical protein F4604DRAFT_1691313 [Suillus subluteus]